MGVGMKISVVLATYNGQKYILEQIESIHNQTVKADEVIITDDGSTDDTVAIIKKFIIDNDLNSSWYVYENKKNLGYKLNFKKAFSLATGDVIILSDQDDIWEENKIQAFQDVFQKTKALAINSSFRFIDNEGNLVHKEENNNNNNLLKEDVLPDQIKKISFETIVRNNISPGCTMAVRTELVKIFLEVTKGILPHDWELNIIAALKDSLYFYNKKLTRYRIHGENEIGMTTDLRKSKPSPNLSYEQRCHNISERMKLKNFFDSLSKYNLVEEENKEIFEKLYKYDELRYSCVVKRNPLVWFLMIEYGVRIRKFHYIRLRELLGDLYFSMRSIR